MNNDNKIENVTNTKTFPDNDAIGLINNVITMKRGNIIENINPVLNTKFLRPSLSSVVSISSELGRK